MTDCMNRAKQQSSDSGLLPRLKQGDEAAVAEWFRLYEKRLLRFFLAKVSNKKDAEELVQDTFLSCIKHLPVFRGESSIWTWMCRIAQHEAADYFRKKYAKRVLKTLPMGDLVLAAPIQDAHETSARVKHVLAQMAQPTAELLRMKYIDKKKVKEIATELNRSVKAIESDLFRARQEFQALWVALE